MIGLVLVTHGRLATEFRVAMEHVVGPQEAIETICIGPDDDMESRRADIAVFNLDEVAMRDIEKVRDVPNGDGGMTWRWTRPPAPMRLTLVNGEPTFEDGKFTGRFPGELVSPTLS